MKKIIINKAHDDTQFVGLKIKNNVVKITFPIGYNIDPCEFSVTDSNISNYYEDIKILLNSLDVNTNDYYEAGSEKFSFSSAAHIIENYLKYGDYKENRGKTIYNGSGKIDWKKTIAVIEPIYSNGNIIYNNYYTLANGNQETIITRIQSFCLYASIKVIGWLYGIKNISEIQKINMSNEEMLYYLNKELYNTNEDNKKNILKDMINFISGTSISDIIENQEISIGRYHYDKVWENILREQMYRMFDKVTCFPDTYYKEENGTIYKNSNLIPDIVVKIGNKIVIVDAKYYKIGFLPQTSDICKQMFYGQYIKSKNKKKEIINIFLLPNQLNTYYSYYGYAATEHLEDKIYTYYLDIKSVLKNSDCIYVFIKNLIENKLG